MLVKCTCGEVRQKCKPCPRCGPKRKHACHRGYDYTHQKIKRYESKQVAFQLCVHCKRKGKRREATDLDHIIPFRGKHDPRRTDPYNRQPLCKACHEAKTVAERKGEYDVTTDLKERRLALSE